MDDLHGNEALTRLAEASEAYIGELRRARRQRFWFRLAGLALFLMLAVGFYQRHEDGIHGAHTALIEIKGEIGGVNGVTADDVIASLQDAFKAHGVKGVVLRCNSPGGSPVQAGQIYDEIRRLRALHPALPVYGVVDEICASGGYYIIVATDRIYVDKASIIGSIGVIMDGFGFTDAMKKLGVERRLLTAGKSKGLLDPFSPRKPEDEQYVQTMLNEVHAQFIHAVRDGRGKRLKERPDLFTGLVWHGVRGIELGLADDLGSLDRVARSVVKAEDIVDYSRREGWAERLMSRLGTAIGANIGFLTQAAPSVH